MYVDLRPILIPFPIPKTNKGLSHSAKTLVLFVWAHQGMILGPPDYESGALTN
jgi:hypothetical protein